MDKDYQNLAVLLVDDDSISTKVLQLKLNNLNINQIYRAHNGLEGLEFIQRNEKIDLIFLDINMPEMDGVEFLRHLVDFNFPGAIIIISGMDEGIISMVSELSEAHRLNFLASMQKSECFKDLEGILEKFLFLYPLPSKKKNTLLNNAQAVLQGIQKGEFINFYQPKIALASEEIVGCESLIRWNHPKFGILSPQEFLPLLHEIKESLTLTKVVIVQAMDQLSKLLQQKPNFNLSINITAQDLNWLNLPNFIAEQANLFKIKPKQLIFEITETELFTNLATALETLTKLKLLGFQLSIDDFGTGGSNLEKLHLIKFDEIKIDKRFVHNAHLNQTAQAILKFSCMLGKSLNLIITAEGVESSEDQTNLLALGVDQAQGFYYFKPMPIEQLILAF